MRERYVRVRKKLETPALAPLIEAIGEKARLGADVIEMALSYLEAEPRRRAGAVDAAVAEPDAEKGSGGSDSEVSALGDGSYEAAPEKAAKRKRHEPTAPRPAPRSAPTSAPRSAPPPTGPQDDSESIYDKDEINAMAEAFLKEGDPKAEIAEIKSKYVKLEAENEELKAENEELKAESAEHKAESNHWFALVRKFLKKCRSEAATDAGVTDPATLGF